MQFPTLAFAVFYAITLTAAWASRRQRVLRNLLLLVASYVFYGALSWKFVLLLLASSLVFYWAGEGIAGGRRTGVRRSWLILSIGSNVLLLAAFKYFNFFSESIADLARVLGLGVHLPVLEVLFPIGISFYVFQGISYSLDLYWRRGVRAGSIIDFLLYQSLFPQLLAGPICRSRELLTQIMEQPPSRVPEVTRAATLILSGLFKKVVLAHLIDTAVVTDVFSGPENYTAGVLWAALAGYTLLIYWDFSGYTDLARGLGLLLGFRIPENFDHPYVATDISDFWRRWHMTLSFWLRDYLFLPLASRWCGGLRRWLGRGQSALWGSQLALLVTFFICGLWHGAAWTFVLWGLYHGALLFVHHGLRNGLRLKWRGGWWGRAGTLLLVALGWAVFRADNLDNAGRFLRGLLDWSEPQAGVGWLVIAVLVLGFTLQIWGPRLREGYMSICERSPWALRPVVWLATGVVILLLKPPGIAPYIYFGF